MRASPAIDLQRLRKQYGGIRPLRIESLQIQPAERAAIVGLDGPASAALVNLITGATLPDEGEVRIFGESTAALATGADWMASLDRFGIVSPRAVLLEGSSLAQNLALPFTLDLDAIPPEVDERVQRLAGEVGIAATALPELLGRLPVEIVIRVHLARAIALDPRVLLLEHPTATLSANEAPRLAADLVRVAAHRQLTLLAATQDETFAFAVAERTLRLNAATGVLTDFS